MKRILSIALLTIFAIQSTTGYSQLVPDPMVVSGDATFLRAPDGKTLDINTTTSTTVFDWTSGLSVCEGCAINFNQPTNASWAINYDKTGNPSLINGTLASNGLIALFNGAGVYVSNTGFVNAAGFLASTLNASMDSIKNGLLNQSVYELIKDPNQTNGFIINEGTIQVNNQGQVVLAGGAVKNDGMILATLGKVNIAAGEKMALTVDHQGLMSVVVDSPVTTTVAGIDAPIVNNGLIQTDGGITTLTAKTLQGVFESAINNQGVIKADSLMAQNGEIYLVANDRVKVGGVVSAVGGSLNVDSQGANYTGVVNVSQGQYNANDGDTFISGNFIGNQTFTDNLNIFINGNLAVAGNLTILADYDDNGTGFLQQYKGTKASATGDVSLRGADIYINNFFFGGLSTNVFEASARYGELKLGWYTDNLGQVVEDGRIISAIGGLQNTNVFASESNYTSENNPDSVGSLASNNLFVQGGVGDHEYTWLKFDLTSLASYYVEDATLYVFVQNTPGGPTDIGAYLGTNDNWNQATLTWNNQPLGSIAANPTDVTTPVQNAYTTWTATGDVNTELLKDGVASWMLKYYGHDSSTQVKMWSQNKPGTNFDPYLDIKYFEIGAGNINLGALGNDINRNDLTLGQVITKGDVSLFSYRGAIKDLNGNQANVVGNRLIAAAQNGIGALDSLETRVNQLAVINQEGDVDIDNYAANLVVGLAGIGIHNNSNTGKISLSSTGNISIDEPILSAGGPIDVTAGGNIVQNDIIGIQRIDTGLWGAPTNVVSTSHLTGVWQFGISNDNTVDMTWELPEADLTAPSITLIAGGTYTMNPGSSIVSCGGLVSITAGNDITLRLVDASSGNVNILSTAGSIIDGDLGDSPLETDIIGRTINLSAPTGSVGGIGGGQEIDLAPSPTMFSFAWDTNSNTVVDSLPDGGYTYTFDLSTKTWKFAITSAALPDSVANYFHIKSVRGSNSSATVHAGAYFIDTLAPTIVASRAAGSEANSFGWNNNNVTVQYAVGDGLSGVLNAAPSDYGDDVVTTEGVNQSTSGIVYDLAGNFAIASLGSINIDKTAPTISASAPLGTQNPDGTWSTNVTVNFDGQDALSGIAPSGALNIPNVDSQTTLGEGIGQFLSSTIFDLAGNSASLSAGPFTVDFPTVVSGLIGDEFRFKIPTRTVTENFEISFTQGPVAFVANQVFFYRPIAEVGSVETPVLEPQMYDFIDGNITVNNPGLLPLEERRRPGVVLP